MEAFQLSPKGVKLKGGMTGVDFKKSEGLLVLARQIRVSLEELSRPFRVASPICRNVGKANIGNIDGFPADELKSERAPGTPEGGANVGQAFLAALMRGYRAGTIRQNPLQLRILRNLLWGASTASSGHNS